MSRLPDETLKKLFIKFLELLPFSNLDIKNCNQAITKIIIARSFKLGQLIQDGEWYS